MALFSVSGLTGTALPMIIVIVLAHAHGLRQYTKKGKAMKSRLCIKSQLER